VVVALAAGAQILGVLYGPEYAEHSTILVWIMIAAAIGYVASFGGYGITAARYFRVQIPLFAMVAGTAAAACFWLVPGSGLLGAARALLVAALAQVFGTGLLIVHAIRARTGVRSEKKACETFPEL
jgi:O-antigen/teichoic acid export membrane protein